MEQTSPVRRHWRPLLRLYVVLIVAFVMILLLALEHSPGARGIRLDGLTPSAAKRSTTTTTTTIKTVVPNFTSTPPRPCAGTMPPGSPAVPIHNPNCVASGA